MASSLFPVISKFNGPRYPFLISLVGLCLYLTLFISVVSAFGSVRCYNICQRSEFEMKCRRCRFREPLRFGKRGDGSLETNDFTSLPVKPWKATVDGDNSNNDQSPNHQNLMTFVRLPSISSASSTRHLDELNQVQSGLLGQSLLLRYLLAQAAQAQSSVENFKEVDDKQLSGLMNDS